MAVGLIDKITNVFMTEDDEYKEYIEEVKPKAPEPITEKTTSL